MNTQFIDEISSINAGNSHAFHISSFPSMFSILDAKLIELQVQYPVPLLKILLMLCHTLILLAYLTRSLMKLLD